MALNMSAIMDKAQRYAKSKDGIMRQNEVIQHALKHNNGILPSGKKIISDETMEQAVAKFIHVLCETARSYGLPQSVMNHLETADQVGGLHIENGDGFVYIYFGGDMFRPSLYDEYEGPNGERGAQNIVAIFNNGYHAKNYVYGPWTGHDNDASKNSDPMRTSWEYNKDWSQRFVDPFIRSRREREGLHFIQQAIDDFNGNYGSQFNVTAKIENTIYEE